MTSSGHIESAAVSWRETATWCMWCCAEAMNGRTLSLKQLLPKSARRWEQITRGEPCQIQRLGMECVGTGLRGFEGGVNSEDLDWLYQASLGWFASHPSVSAGSCRTHRGCPRFGVHEHALGVEVAPGASHRGRFRSCYPSITSLLEQLVRADHVPAARVRLRRKYSKVVVFVRNSSRHVEDSRRADLARRFDCRHSMRLRSEISAAASR